MERKDIEHEKWSLTEEAEGIVENGSPEALVFAAIPPEGITLENLKVFFYNSHILVKCAYI